MGGIANGGGQGANLVLSIDSEAVMDGETSRDYDAEKNHEI
jgi:hypothetical protein